MAPYVATIIAVAGPGRPGTGTGCRRKAVRQGMTTTPRTLRDPYAAAAASAARLAELTGCPAHDAAVVLGSGWLPAADALGTPDAAGAAGRPRRIPAAHRRRPRARRPVGPGRAAAGAGLPRPHPPVRGARGRPQVVHGVRTAVAAGCRVDRADQRLRRHPPPAIGVGQPVLISDHLNLTARSPLAGPPPPDGLRLAGSPTCPTCTRRGCARIARAADPELAEGVYAALPGPHYETPAEIRDAGRDGRRPGRHVHRA